MSDRLERVTCRHCKRCNMVLTNGRGGCDGAQHDNKDCAMNNPLANADLSEIEQRVMASLIGKARDATMLAATDALVKGLGITHIDLETVYGAPKESYRDRVIGMSTERGDFIVNDDGYQVYWPKRESLGYLGAAELRILADHLDWLNAEWDAEVKRLLGKPADSAPAVEMQPGSPNFDGAAAYERYLDATVSAS